MTPTTRPLLHGALVRLVAIDTEATAAQVAAWSRDSDFLRLLSTGAARHWTEANVRRHTEEFLGKDAPRPNVFAFHIRTLADDRLIGLLDFEVPHGPHRDAWVAIGLGEREFWGKGYGTDAMRAGLRYAFTELNLARVSLTVFGYNQRALRSYLKTGFVVEGAQRQYLQRDGQRWDIISMGLLRQDWLALPENA
jgi:RimJ/RimL family protein N-acetyltransferase